MDVDDKIPGLRNVDEDCEIKASPLGQSTPILEGDLSNAQLVYLLLDRKAATSASTFVAGISAPTTASSSASASTTSMASSSFKVSTPVMADSSARVSIPAMAFSLARIYGRLAGSSSAQVSTPMAFPSAYVSPPAIASSSAQFSPSTTGSSSAQNRHYKLIPEVGTEEGDMHPIRVLEAHGEDLTGEKRLLDQYYFYAWTRYPVNKVVVRRNRVIGGPGNGTLCWSQGGGKESVKIDKDERKSQASIIGWKRKFKLAGNSGKRPLEIIKIGSQSYTFKLDELVTVKDEEKEKAAILEKETPQSFLCIYRLKPTKKLTADHHPGRGIVVHEADGQNSPIVLPSSIQPLTVPQDLRSPQASSLHDPQSSIVGARIDRLESFGSAHPLVLPISVQPLTGQENVQMPEPSSLDKDGLQWPIVDSGTDHLLCLFHEDEISSIGIASFLDWGSADLGPYGQNGPLVLPSSAQQLIGSQDPKSSQALSLCDLQWPILDSWLDQFQSCRSAHPGLDGQISPLDLQSSAQPLAEQQDLQWPQESSSHHPQLPMGDSRIDHLENYGTADPGPDGDNPLLVLPTSVQRLTELQDMQLPQASSLQDAQSNTLHFRVDDLLSCGSAYPEPSGQDSLLDLTSSRQHGQDLQLPEAPLDTLSSFPPAKRERKF